MHRWEYVVSGLLFVFGGSYYTEMLMALGGMRFEENLEVNFREGCMRSVQCNVGFGYQLNICSRTEENHGRPCLSCLRFILRDDGLQRFSMYCIENAAF